MTTKEQVHELVDRLDAGDLSVVERVLKGLLAIEDGEDADRLFSLDTAPADDEPETQEERAAVAAAREDYREGRVVSHDEMLREFGR